MQSTFVATKYYLQFYGIKYKLFMKYVDISKKSLVAEK